MSSSSSSSSAASAAAAAAATAAAAALATSTNGGTGEGASGAAQAATSIDLGKDAAGDADGDAARPAACGAAAEPAALDLGTASAWEGATDEAEVAADRFYSWRADPGMTNLVLELLGLRRFPVGFWEQAQGVEVLYLSSNDLTGLPAELGRLGASLRGLDLSDNPELKTLPGAALAQLTMLEELSLSDTGVVSLPDELFAMSSLRRLDLSVCEALMTAGPAEGVFPRLGQMTNLTELFLHRSGLRGELDTAVGNMVNLEELRLSDHPELTGIPEETLGQLVNLTSLNLSKCKSLVAVPASIGRLTRLELLHCGVTGLETLPPQIGDCVALKDLFLNGCKSLTHLPPSLSRCPTLEHLGLSDMPALQSPPPEVVARIKRDDPGPVMDYLRQLDAGRLTKGAGAAGC